MFTMSQFHHRFPRRNLWSVGLLQLGTAGIRLAFSPSVTRLMLAVSVASSLLAGCDSLDCLDGAALEASYRDGEQTAAERNQSELERGRQEALRLTRRDGETDGYNDGYDAVYYDCYDQAYPDGYNAGYDDGFYGGLDAGYSEGYDDGYSDGASDC